VASLCLLKVEVLLIPALAGLLGRLGARLWQLYVKLAGQVQGRFDWSVEATHRGPHVRDVAVKSAGKTMNVVLIDVHARVIVLVLRRHTTSLAAVTKLDKPADGHLFSQCLKNVHTGALLSHEVRRFGSFAIMRLDSFVGSPGATC
jgi:hypothetical protein